MLHAPIKPKRKNTHHLPYIYHLIWIMTSFPTFVPFRVNDLPCGIMGRVISSHWCSQRTSDQSCLKALTLLRPLLTESDSLITIKLRASINSLSSTSWFDLTDHTHCNPACRIVPEQLTVHQAHYYFLYYVFTLTRTLSALE